MNASIKSKQFLLIFIFLGNSYYTWPIAYYFIIMCTPHWDIEWHSTSDCYETNETYERRTLLQSINSNNTIWIANSIAKTIKLIGFNDFHCRAHFTISLKIVNWMEAQWRQNGKKVVQIRVFCLPQLYRANDPIAIARPTIWNLDLRRWPICSCRHSEIVYTKMHIVIIVRIIVMQVVQRRSIAVHTSWEKATAVTPPTNSPIPNTYNVCNESELQIRTCACDLRSEPARCPDATNSRDGCMSMLQFVFRRMWWKAL